MIHPIKNLLSLPLVVAAGLLCTTPAALGEEAVADQSYVAGDGARVIRQSIVLEAPIERIWNLYTTGEGLQSWASPTVEVDLRIGGTISSNFKVGATIGEPGTVVTEIVNLVPEAEIVLRDDLVSLLTMGGLFEWLDMFPQEFLTQLETEGDDVYTLARFDSLDGNRTRLTLFAYGYGEGTGWDRVYEEAKKSNIWFLENLAKRLAEGPIDWSQQQ